MSFNQSQYIQLNDNNGKIFSGGVVDNLESNLLPYSKTPYGRNFRLDGQGCLVRPGYSILGANLGGTGENPFGIGAYERFTASNNRIIVGYKQSGTEYLVSVEINGIQTPITTGALVTVEDRMEFFNFGDSIYCMNGTDLYGKLTGTTYTNPTTGVVNFFPSYGVTYNGSAWVSGVNASANILFKSVTDNADDFSSLDSDEISFGEPITGLETNNESLYVFTRNGLDVINDQTIRDVGGVLTYSSKNLLSREGAINNASIVSFGRITFFLTPSNKIKTVSPGQGLGFDLTDLSHRKFNGIDKTMQSLDSDQSESFAYADTENNLIKWHLKTKGSSFNDIVVIYDVERDEFLVDTNKFFIGGTMLDNVSYTISSLEDKIYTDEFGQTDDDTEIQFEYRSKLLDLGIPSIQKEIWQSRFHFKMNDQAELKQSIFANGGQIDTVTYNSSDIPVSGAGIGTTAVGAFAIGTAGFTGTSGMQTITKVREKGLLQVRAENFQYIYTCSSLAGQVQLLDVTPKFQILDQLVSEN